MSTLRTHELTKSYSGRTGVRGVSLDVASGEVVGLLGPNGAGKTTTFYMTVGLTSPDSGRVFLDDEDLTDDPMYARARKGIGYLPQEPSIFRGLSVEQNIMAILETLPLDADARAARLQGLLGELNLTPLAMTDIQKIIFHLKERGIGILITDHNVRETLRITDRAYIVHDGVIFKSGTPQSLADDEEVKRIYLGADFRLD